MIDNINEQALRQAYGILKVNDYVPTNYICPDLGRKVAEYYADTEAREIDKNDYQYLIHELELQYGVLRSFGFNICLVNYSPTDTADELFRLFELSKIIQVYSTDATDSIDNDHPLSADSGYLDTNGRHLLWNDIFRLVHDAIGHCIEGNDFSPVGEENAFRMHLSTIQDERARKVLALETRMQNWYYNFHPTDKGNFPAQKCIAVPYWCTVAS